MRRWSTVCGSLPPLLLSTLSLVGQARGQELFSDPVWTPSVSALTVDLAVGDVDVDGDLDLVRGNLESACDLFLNTAGALDLTALWSTAAPEITVSAALGDVNGDGWLDLVLGHASAVTLYLNRQADPFFPPAPDERFEVGASSIALADADRDGDLDLVAGGMQRTVVLRNDGQRFDHVPVWAVDVPGGRVAVGDIDDDGDADLVTAAAQEQQARLYRGSGGFFEATPFWQIDAVAAGHPSSLALGDLDGDGDLDLALGAFQDGVRLFENLGTTFASTPARVLGGTPADGEVNAVTLGDLDGDADLEIVAAATTTVVYRSTGGLTQWMVAWSTGAGTAAALADIDGDGNRDLILAEKFSRMFRNQTPLFTGSGEATTIPGFPLAIADLDDDGDADLVATEVLGVGRVHLGDAGLFQAQVVWTASDSASQSAEAAAIGDVDGDGRPDLVLGGAGVALYLHTDSLFAAAPAWSVQRRRVRAVGLGDVDRDGDLDLVACDQVDQTAELWLNRNGTFATAPDWTALVGAAHGVALGDMDGDRDLDLALAAFPNSALFRFDRTTFQSVPAWTGPGKERVLLGDIDGDADLDLVVAIGGEPVHYRNDDGVLALAWSAQSTQNGDAVLTDLDADGDLDLLAGSVSSPPAAFLNVNGTFSDPSPQPIAPGRRWVVGDVDRDGDLDVVAGRELTSDIGLFRGGANPVFRGDPAAPTHQLPNNDPFVRSVRVTLLPDNRRQVEFTAVDVESDSIWLWAEYQSRGARGWTPAETGDRRQRIGPLATSPGGVAHTFAWDLTRIGSALLPLDLRLRATPYRQRDGEAQRIASYVHDVGKVVLQRAEITASPLSIELPTITVGDTVFTVVEIANSGNEPLFITDFEFERTTMMRTNPTDTLEIAPGVRAQVLVYYEPTAVEPTESPGQPRFLHIYSNDPVHARVPVMIYAEALALAGRAQALLPEFHPAPLGQPIVVQFIPAPFVHVETARLFHAFDGFANYDSVAMDRLGGTFIASIPGQRVTEYGVVFYVEYRNSTVVATDPPGAPVDSIFVRGVEAPSEIRVVPQPTSRSDFLAGREINVQVTLPAGAEFRSGSLYYRPGGRQAFASEPIQMDLLNFITRATIPAAAVGARGLEYYVTVRTARAEVRYPLDGDLAPDSIRTLVPSLAEPASYPGGRYRMISMPLDFGAAAPRPLDALLVDQPEFGPYDPARWRAFRYLGAEGNVERAPGDPRFDVVPGRAFWLVSRSDHRVDTAPAEGLSVRVAPFTLQLAPGWNQVGHPFAFPVAWAATRRPPDVEPPVAFDPGRGSAGEYSPEPASILEPFQGYFVYNAADSVVLVSVPPIAAPPDTAVGVGASHAPTDTWWIDLTARAGTATDGGNRAGVDRRALPGADGLDRHEPPVAPGEWVRLAFVASASDARAAALTDAALLRRDVRAPDPTGHTWTLDLSSGAGREVAIDVRVSGDVPAEFDVAWIDDDQGGVVPVPRRPGVDWTATLQVLAPSADRPYRMRLVAGTAQYIADVLAGVPAPPAHVTFEPNAPNPFNAATRLRFGLPSAVPVRLELFDVRGRRIAVLVDGMRPPGWHSIVWHGRDTAGRAVASGVYIARLRTPLGVLTRRLTAIE